MKENKNIENNSSTEEKIKEAARRVFTRKGYAATRTRDIAEESGFNLALINYYFRSKEKLFDIIMLEAVQTFVHSIMGIVNDHETTLHEKMQVLISHYIDMLIENPGLPIFIFNGINSNPELLIKQVGIDVDHSELYIVKQWNELQASGMLPDIHPIHFMLNIISMTVFPFMANPMIRNRFKLSIEEYNKLMLERKKLIPFWVKAILNSHRDEMQKG